MSEKEIKKLIENIRVARKYLRDTLYAIHTEESQRESNIRYRIYDDMVFELMELKGDKMYMRDENGKMLWNGNKL